MNALAPLDEIKAHRLMRYRELEVAFGVACKFGRSVQQQDIAKRLQRLRTILVQDKILESLSEIDRQAEKDERERADQNPHDFPMTYGREP